MGTTASGKEVHVDKEATHEHYNDFTEQDHIDAADLYDNDRTRDAQDNTDMADSHINQAAMVGSNSYNGEEEVEKTDAVDEDYRPEDHGFKIGHTYTDKPVYSAKSAKDYKGFNKKDHASAANLHAQASRDAMMEKLVNKAKHHSMMEDEHDKASKGEYKKFKMKKANEDELEKGIGCDTNDDILEKGGEGSKGGKIIGHTKSGKPVYQGKTAYYSGYKDFTKKDHKDASDLHNKLFEKQVDKGGDYSASMHAIPANTHGDIAYAKDEKESSNKGDKEDSKTLADRYKELKDGDDKGELTHNDIVRSMKGSHGASSKDVNEAIKEHGVEKHEPKKIKKSLSDRVLDNMLEKGEISNSLSGYWGNGQNKIEFTKTGKEIKEKIPTIIQLLQDKLAELATQMAVYKKEAGSEPCSPMTSSVLKYLEGYNNYTWDDTYKWDKDHGVESKPVDNPMRKYNNACYVALSVAEDIATLKAMKNNVSDKKSYELSLNQLLALGFGEAE